MLFNYTVAHGQAESGAAAVGFSGEKGIENTVNMLAGNTRTGVDDFDLNAAVVRGGAYFQHASSGHGVASVQEQIKEDLLKLVR